MTKQKEKEKKSFDLILSTKFTRCIGSREDARLSGTTASPLLKVDVDVDVEIQVVGLLFITVSVLRLRATQIKIIPTHFEFNFDNYEYSFLQGW